MANMSTVAVLPVKRFDDALHRLSCVLGGGARAFLAQSMFRDVLSALSFANCIDEVAVVTGDRQAQDIAIEHGLWVIDDPKDSGHSSAVVPVLDQCSRRDYGQALLVPVDCPMINPAEIDNFIRKTSNEDVNVVIVPDHHGTGTNALLLRPPAAMAPSFGEDSARIHREKAEEKGLRHRIEHIGSLELDVDTSDDLDQLHMELERAHGLAPLTRGSVRQLKRMADADAARREAVAVALAQ